MRQISRQSALLLVLGAAGTAWGGAFPWGGGGPSREPHPATVALRDYSATVRTNLGEIELALEPDAAPNAVRMFLKLAGRGDYDGARFQSIFKGRMAVLAAPPSQAKAEGDDTIAHEDTRLPASEGAVLMDKAADGRNSPGRLLILLGDQGHLERSYTVFARVRKGQDVLRRIGAAATRPNDGSPAPIEDIVIEQVLVVRKQASGPEEDAKK